MTGQQKEKQGREQNLMIYRLQLVSVLENVITLVACRRKSSHHFVVSGRIPVLHTPNESAQKVVAANVGSDFQSECFDSLYTTKRRGDLSEASDLQIEPRFGFTAKNWYSKSGLSFGPSEAFKFKVL